ITPNTKWVAVTGASNLIGTMPDLRTVIALARHVDARVFVDGVHLVPHMPPTHCWSGRAASSRDCSTLTRAVCASART
ncbi:MAG: aminotransferase class V-fold PLP-dependent enzyme, partial [Actinomycetota bacterium]